MNEEQIKNFMNQVNIASSNESNCEYEVSENAMKSYKSYEYYNNKNWEVKEFENSIFAYYKEKDKASKLNDYKGSYLLCYENDNQALTGDILTSIKRPFVSIIMNNKPLNGKGIFDLLNELNTSECDLEIFKYMKAFAKVYYWCGNMMPVICNWKGNGDEAINKIITLREKSGTEYYTDKLKNGKLNGRSVKPSELLPSWRCCLWPEWENFVNAYYFNDYVDKCGNPRKNDIPFFELNNIKEWMRINTELIIQRSYRINRKFVGEWSPEQEKDIEKILKLVFQYAGIEAKDDKPQILRS